MSLLSILGKIGAIGAAPFTGGASLSALPMIDALGNVLGSGATASKQGRSGDAVVNDRLNEGNNVAALNAAKFNLDTPVTRAQQVAKGDLMAATIPNASTSGTGRNIQFSGGLNPGLFGGDTTSAGNELKRQALSALMTRSDTLRPQMTTMQQPGLLEKLGGAAGLAGGVLGAIRSTKPPVAMTMDKVYEPSDENGWG